ncbi:MAG: hypothetical protein ACI4TD_09930 [Phocaeicola sp.]
MRKLSILLFLAVATSMYAKTLRVSNVNGSTAPYSTVAAALADAVDGDVIMVDASPKSYGDVEITKKITLQGPGFFLVANGIAQEGQTTAEFGDITIKKEGVKVSSISAKRIEANNFDKVVITRCWAREISIYNTSGAIVHQNFIRWELYTRDATNAQITNNIIIFFSNQDYLDYLKNSVVKYNTFLYSSTLYHKETCKDCVFEYNIGNFTDTDSNNTVRNNNGFTQGYYNDPDAIDSTIKALDQALTTSHGAFAGYDPYRISGVAAGPVIEDIDVPASVEQGSDLKVKVTIGTKK